MELVAGGIYQHYKGPHYRVLGVVLHSETLEELVLYECLYKNESCQFWVRPRAMFEGTVTVDGVQKPRFKQVESA